MSPQQMYRNVKAGSTYLKMEKDFFRWLRTNKQEELLLMQQKQLFEYSIGADGKRLGFYEKDDRKRGKNRGKPFTMIATGQLFEKMRVRVNIGRSEIDFINLRKNIAPYDVKSPILNFRWDEDVFLTADWFGLAPIHMKRLLSWAEQYATLWILAKLKTGDGRKYENQIQS